MNWARIADRVIWGMYLAAILLCAWVTTYAITVDKIAYAWAGAIGWLVSMTWGLFFRYHVRDRES